MNVYYRRVKQFHYFRILYFKSNLVDKRVTSLLNNKFESMWLQNTIFYKLPEGIFCSVQEKFRLSSLHYYHLRRMLLQRTRKNKSAVVEHSTHPLLIRDVVSVSSTSFPGSQRQDSWQVLEADKRASVSHAICQILK
jgi:hypothetical protein